MQHLNRSPLQLIVIEITRGCPALEHKKFQFKNCISPPWWPSEVPFSNYSAQTKPNLITLLTALMSEGKKQELESDFTRVLYQARAK